MATNDVKPKIEEADVDMDDSESDVKPKRSPSVSVPPTPSSTDGGVSVKPSPSPAPVLNSKASRNGSPSKKGTPSRSSSTPVPGSTSKANGNGNAASKPGPQLIGDLPRAEKEAMKTFVELEENHYQYSTLGLSREELESMTCDCTFVPGRDDPDMACGHGSDCINRLTQVECLEDDCRCRGYCKNQRMQRRDYANIEIVLTEKKGFGLRAGSDLQKDAFIYEYIGDVVNHPSFKKRMRAYAEEGIRHFYFMMLQKDEYIDATKRGGIGRFANHSCNPNCYVAKWTVGEHVRMGIYAKRNIKKHEELTFNYNVDRYGHDAQPCYCGEPNCVGFLGGKTQTDVAAMDDLYLDALGISEEVEMYGLKGTKKKKGKKLDEDYVPILKPLIEKDIPKVIQAIRQTQSRKVLLKLLSRIKMTDDQPALRQIMRLRGYSLMCNIIKDYLSDIEICTIAMESLLTWPLLQRNKVEDSKIEEPIGELVNHESETVSSLAKKLLEHWASLETGYRIPKRLKGDGEEASTPSTPAEVITFEEQPSYKKVKQMLNGELEERVSPATQIKPLGRRRCDTPRVRPMYPVSKNNSKAKEEKVEMEVEAKKYWWQFLNVDPQQVKEKLKEQKEAEQKTLPTAAPRPFVLYDRKDPNEIIADAVRKVEEKKREEARIATEKEQKEKEEAERRAKRAKEKEKAHKRNMTPEEKESLKEKRLQKLVGQIVVKCLSKHKDQLDHDTFKKKAKELTCIIAEKEKRSHSYQQGKLDALSDEKVIKIKKFAKEYIAKLLRRLEKQNSEGKPSSSHTSSRPSGSGSGSTGKDAERDRDHEPMMSVEDALDLGPDDNELEDEGLEDEEEEKSGDPSPASDLTGRGPGPAVTVVGRDVSVDAADLDADGDVQMGGGRSGGMSRKSFGSSTTPTPTSSPLKSRWDQAPGSSSSIPTGL
ncbi:hypothetical protein ACEPAG_9673 [Sanghuangporus baumii]